MSIRAFLITAVLVVVAGTTGCVGRFDEMSRRFSEMDMKVKAVSRTNGALRGRIDELENRILLLQDEVESQRLMGMRAGHRSTAASGSQHMTPATGTPLPVVRLVPGDAAAMEYVAGADISEPYSYETDYAYREYDQAVSESESSRSDGGSLDISDSYQGIDDMGRLIPSPKETSSTKKPARKKKSSAKKKKARDNRKIAARILEQYKAAYVLYGEGRVNEARKAFNRFVSEHPAHAYADNARYWVGECWYDIRDYEKARTEFMRVISDYPDGNKVPDAMVKVGFSDQNLGRTQDARRMYDAVILTYPDSEAARVAMKLIGKLR